MEQSQLNKNTEITEQKALSEISKPKSTTRERPGIIVEYVKKTKKNEPKVFPSLLIVDREAFGRQDETVSTLKAFWNSKVNKLIVARKEDSKSIVGYACFIPNDKKTGCYLMRIAVRSRCQRQGIGRILMEFMFNNFPDSMALDVSSDNTKAISFYKRVGLIVQELYISQEKVEFHKFITPDNFVYKSIDNSTTNNQLQANLTQSNSNNQGANSNNPEEETKTQTQSQTSQKELNQAEVMEQLTLEDMETSDSSANSSNTLSKEGDQDNVQQNCTDATKNVQIENQNTELAQN